MVQLDAPGLTADWLNAWLAAIGAAVLVDGLQLRWTDEQLPHAVFTHPRTTPIIELIAAALPHQDEAAYLAIARVHPDASSEFPRKATHAQHRDRARIARSNGDPSLAISTTDLDDRDGGHAAHSPFDPPAPQGKTLWDRLTACLDSLGNPLDAVTAALIGPSRRVQTNGLGFDYRRILSPADPVGEVWVDPAVEVLAFAGLTLTPTRGDGHRATHRGWTARPTRRGSFSWPVWTDPLDAPAIDALLDKYWGNESGPNRNIMAVYESVPYAPRGSMDQTRGFGAHRRS